MVDFHGREIKNVLIRSVNWIGDAILTTPAITALRNNFPKAKISILAKPYVSEIFRENPDIDEIIPYEVLGIRKGFILINEIRKRGFDLAVLFQNAFEAALISFLSGIPVRLGYATDGRAFLLNPSINVSPDTKKKHHLDYYLDLLSNAGFNTERGPLVLNLKEEERIGAIDLLKKEGWNEGDRLVGINPGAAYGKAKRWYPERFASLADRIMKEDVKIVIFGGPKDSSIIEVIKKEIVSRPIFVTGNTSVRKLASLIERCAVFVSNDTGPMHMASALNIPVVALFGSTDMNITGPVGEKHKVIWKKVECSPCFLRECPKDFRCMNLITVDEVVDAVIERLAV